MGQKNVLKDVAHRQWVFTTPKVLRNLFYKDRLLLAELACCAAATILKLYKAIFPDNHSRPGIIASTQTFGDLLIWNPHIYCLATEDVFDLAGSFHPVSGIDSDQATILFRERFFAIMKGREQISDGLGERQGSPGPAAVEARVSPLNFGRLQKLTTSRH